MLSACPSSPNCVSTVAPPDDSQHTIVPYQYRKSRPEAKEVLKTTIAGLPRTKLIEEDETYLHYEFTSLLLRFVDDVEFLFDEDEGLYYRDKSYFPPKTKGRGQR